MKKRQLEILEYILQNKSIEFKTILNKMNISSRTLYYDISDINYEIKKYGKINKIKNNLFYEGNEEILKVYNFNKNFLNYKEYRILYILDKLFMEEFTTIENIANYLDVSTSTIVNDIEKIRDDLKLENIELIFDKVYKFVGNENDIRNYYIKINSRDQNLLNYLDDRILKINRVNDIQLTDYSISLLSKYLKFADIRRKSGNYINYNNLYDDVVSLYYFNSIREILNIENINEVKYFTAYIASMTNQKNTIIDTKVNDFVDKLIYNFEFNFSMKLNNIKSFKRELSRHLQTSFYRIKYNFPIYNPLLEDIKLKYSYLMNILEKSIQNTKNIIFSNMGQPEIAYLTMYFGANLESFISETKKVVIVCPNGVIISKILESQLYKYLPSIDIVGIVSIHELDIFDKRYDYIISTVNIENYNNVIVVKPILTTKNIFELTEKLLLFNPTLNFHNIDNLVEIIGRNAIIKNEDILRKELLEFLIKKPLLKQNNFNLSNLLTEDKFNRVELVSNWKEAIEIASKPLLESNSIKQQYIEEMILKIKKFGSYIVLSDKIAVPHSDSFEFVNNLDISILQVKKSVKLIDKEVNLFIVISVPDKNSHINLFSTLLELLENEHSVDVLKNGNFNQILEVIKKYEKEIK